MRRRCIPAATLIVALATASASPAATVRGERSSDASQVWTLRVTASPGELNTIFVRYVGAIIVTDSVPLTAGADCTTFSDGVTCEQPGYTSAAIEVEAGDLDDTVTVASGDEIPALLSGGAGDDVLRGSGASRSLFRYSGGDGDDRMIGGLGSDIFLEGPAANGSDVFRSDTGDRRYEDRVVYRERVHGVRADLDGDADDGEPGERDRIGPGVESIIGGAGPDRLVGNASANVLRGAGGNDRLRGGRGRDEIDCGRGFDTVLRDAFDMLRGNCERRRS